MEAGKDPRQPPNVDSGNIPDPPSNSEPRKAPGGVGTGTKDAPQGKEPQGTR